MDIRKILCGIALLVGVAHAQFIGYVASQSSAQVAFTAQAANGSSVIFNNVGQSAHQLLFCNTGFIGTITLQASPDGTFAPAIALASASFVTANGECAVLPAGGYFQTIRANISNYAAGSVNAWYTAVAGPVNVTQTALNSTGPFSPVQCDQTTSFIFNDSAGSISNTIVPALAGKKVYLCSITFSYTSAPTIGGGTLDLIVGTTTTNACDTGTALKWSMNAPTTTSVSAPFYFGGAFGAWMKGPLGNALCVRSNAAVSTLIVSATFAQF
jgi:hypothetical protein